MSRRVDLPDEDRVRQVMAQLVENARNNGTKPTVVSLARALGLNNATFWRHYPEVAHELVAFSRESASPRQAGPNRHDQLVADHAKLKRAHAELQQDMIVAKAVIQRLAVENNNLRQAVEAATNVISIDHKRRGQAPPEREH